MTNPQPETQGITPPDLNIICGTCTEKMVFWPDERYHRCRTCGITIYTTRRPRGYKPSTVPSVVYFLKAGDRVKIGRTQGLAERIASLSLEPTCCVLAIRGGAKEETELHRRFAPYRIHKRREWFDWCDDIARYVEEHQGESVKKEAMRSFLP